MTGSCGIFRIDAGKVELVKLLTYGGTLPPLLCVAGAFVPVYGIDPMRFALCYGAVITAFLCGIHWAIYLVLGDRCRRNLLLYSNAIALAAWVALLIAPQWIALGVLEFCFLVLLKLDSELVANEVYPAWYGALRRNATIIVVLSLCALIGLAYFR